MFSIIVTIRSKQEVFLFCLRNRLLVFFSFFSSFSPSLCRWRQRAARNGSLPSASVTSRAESVSSPRLAFLFLFFCFIEHFCLISLFPTHFHDSNPQPVPTLRETSAADMNFLPSAAEPEISSSGGGSQKCCPECLPADT